MALDIIILRKLTKISHTQIWPFNHSKTHFYVFFKNTILFLIFINFKKNHLKKYFLKEYIFFENAF